MGCNKNGEACMEKDLLTPGLRIEHTEHAGRRLICTKDFKAGDVVLANGAFCSVLHADYLPEKCSFCFTNVGTPEANMDMPKRLRCSRCQISCYCSAACQKADWKMHKHECSTMVPLLAAIDKVHGLSPGALGDSLLVGRLLRHRASVKNSEEAENENVGERQTTSSPLVLQKEGINKVLVSNINDVENLVLDERIWHEEGTLEKYEKLAKVIMTAGKALLPKDTKKQDVIDMLGKFQCNNFSIVDDLFISVGAGIYPVGALLNHSCIPNCVLTYCGKEHVQVMRALLDLKVGDEITHSYCETANPKWLRQKHLQRDYGFLCECIRCTDPKWHEVDKMFVWDKNKTGAVLTDEETTGVDENELPDGFKLAEPCPVREAAFVKALQCKQKAFQCQNNGKLKQELVMLTSVIKLYGDVLHPQHLLMQEARAGAMNTSLAANNEKIALDICQGMCDNYDAVYPSDRAHPIRGLQLCTLGELFCQIQDYDASIATLKKARDELSITHGPFNPLVEAVKVNIRNLTI